MWGVGGVDRHGHRPPLRTSHRGVADRIEAAYTHRDDGRRPFWSSTSITGSRWSRPRGCPTTTHGPPVHAAIPDGENPSASGNVRRRLRAHAVPMVWDRGYPFGVGATVPLPAQDGSGRSGAVITRPNKSADWRCPIRARRSDAAGIGDPSAISADTRICRSRSPIRRGRDHGAHAGRPGDRVVLRAPQRGARVLEFCTEALIRWVKVQKQEIGEERVGQCFPLGIRVPERFGKVWLCDDDCVAIRPSSTGSS